MNTRQWKALVALAGSALFAGSVVAGCGGSGNANIAPSTGGAGGADGGGAAGTAGTGGGTAGTGGGTAGTGGTTSDAGPCSGSEQQCGSTCVNTQTDNNNCGSCGNACSGGSSCQGGQCTCPTGQDLCGGACIDTQTDNANCGSCGNACSGGKTCSAGACACASNEKDCNGTCVNTNTDFNNCGSCGNACTTNQVCSSGACGNNCTGGTKNCNGSCVDTNTDKNNCGSCGNACPAATQTCVGGSCTCPNNGTVCSGACVDTQTDNNNCGTCGTVCSGGATCTSGSCTKAAKCGDGTVDTGEECDDGNTSSLDGCDKSCNYEVFTRMDTVKIQGGGSATAPSFCAHTKNALGNAISNTGLNGSIASKGINDTLQSDIDAGTTNILVQALGLDDLTGVNDSSLQLGATSGQPDSAKGAWPGSSQIDWWYKLDSTTLDSNGVPTSLITPAAIASRALTAGPSSIKLLLNLGGSPALLEMLHSNVHATVGTTTSTPAPPPSTNQLATGLKVFETLTATGSSQGLCGDVTVESLAQIPLPQSLAQGGSNACASGCNGSHAYTYCGQNQPVTASCNSLLDALVGGCVVKVFGTCAVTGITPTQPDVAGSGAGNLTVGTNGKVQQTTAGNTNAYSAWMTFHAQRVHATGTY